MFRLSGLHPFLGVNFQFYDYLLCCEHVYNLFLYFSFYEFICLLFIFSRINKYEFDPSYEEINY